MKTFGNHMPAITSFLRRRESITISQVCNKLCLSVLICGLLIFVLFYRDDLS